jgi:hypothetical protein
MAHGCSPSHTTAANTASAASISRLKRTQLAPDAP